MSTPPSVAQSLPRRATAIVAICLAAGCGDDSPIADEVSFVGSEACAGCHAEQAELWFGSHHDLAMQVATPETVLGDFNGAQFQYAGVTSRFFVRDGQFWVNTDGADGLQRDFHITHTFGVEPLQQYLIETDSGRFQALSIAWDSRAAEQGGQRWFHLYPDDNVDSSDPLHWTHVYQTWNTMCADCHSTGLSKNFDSDQNRFASSWAAIDVACEGCHGAGSQHVAMPANVALSLGSSTTSWSFASGASIANRVADNPAPSEIEVCGQCHSRRTQLTDRRVPGERLLDRYRPVWLEQDLYYADGQILDEVYVYGSFLQSAMHAAGVSCSDCHDPHSLHLRAVGNELCARCHLPSVFDGPQHHHHAAGNTQPECIDCHMRATTYMVVDPRRDHGFKVPRPDLSGRIGSPNACNDCHAERDSAWAAARIAEWYPNGRAAAPHFADALFAGRQWSADRSERLLALHDDADAPALVRATAVSLMAQQLDDSVVSALEGSLADDDELVQLAALDALRGVDAALRARLGQRFLTHPLRALRISAARALVGAQDQLSERRRADFEAALDEYVDVQRFNSDRGEGLVNLGMLWTELGRFDDAEQTYRTAIERTPELSAPYANLVDIYRAQGRESDAEQVARDGLERNPRDPGLNLVLGFSLVRSGQTEQALEYLQQAAEYGDALPYYHYVYGVALNSTGQPERAIDILSRAQQRFPGYRQILVSLAAMLRDRGEFAAAYGYARRLLDLSPTDPQALRLVEELEAAQQGGR